MCSSLSAHFNIYREFVREREFVTYLLTQQRVSCAHIHLYVSRVRERERPFTVYVLHVRVRLMYPSPPRAHHPPYNSLRLCSRSLSPVCVYIVAVRCRVLSCGEVFAHPPSRLCMCTLLQRVAVVCTLPFVFSGQVPWQLIHDSNLNPYLYVHLHLYIHIAHVCMPICIDR